MKNGLSGAVVVHRQKGTAKHQMKQQKDLWLREDDMKVLYDAVRPNPLTPQQFADALTGGQLSPHYKLQELKRIQGELCDMLNRRAHLREASDLRHITKKDTLCAAISLLTTQGPAARAAPPLAAAEVPALVSPQLEPEAPAAAAAQKIQQAATKRGPLCLPRSLVPQMGAGAQRSMFLATIPAADTERRQGTPSADFESPLSPIVMTILRLQVRMGSTTHTFETPRQYAAGLAARSYRVQVVPVTGIATPAAWPKNKEIFVFVNGKPVVTPWKRTWPQRRTEVAKAYLPLDISPLLERDGVQKMQIDCFARDYCGALVMQLVGVVSEADAVKAVQEKHTPDCETMLEYYASFSKPDGDDVQCCDAVVSSKCPILQSRISVPMRGAHCRHLQCFDVGAFLRSCHIGCCWNCPVCDAAILPSKDIVVDGLFHAALQKSHAAKHFLLDSQNQVWAPSSRDASGHVDVPDDDDEMDDDEDDDDDGDDKPARKKSRSDKMGGGGVKGTADDPICL